MLRILWTSVGVLGLGCASDDRTRENPGTAIARIDAEQIYFAQVDPDETESREVRVENVGSADLVISGFQLTGDPDFRFVFSEGGFDFPQAVAPADARVDFRVPLVISPGESTLFQVSFSPENEHLSTGLLTFHTNGAVAKHEIELLANNTLPCLELNPAKVEFGARLVGKKVGVPVEIRSCGGVALQVTEILLASNATGTFGLGVVPLPSHKAPTIAAPLTLEPGQSATFNVAYKPTHFAAVVAGSPQLETAQIQISSNASEAAVEIEVSGFGTDVICPTAVGKIEEGEQVVPPTTLHLSDAGSSGTQGPVVKRKWTVKQQPPGSQAVFSPSGEVPNPTVEVGVAGTYRFALEVWDDANNKSCVPWEGTVFVVPDLAIHVELVWHTPGDSDETDEGAEAGSDLSLHFAHTKYALGSGFDGDKDGVDDPWFDKQYDCFWYNAHPNWGSFDPLANDDPALSRDDTDGAGPEKITLANPQNNVEYRVGVHYWSDHEFGDSLATVRITIHDELVAEFPNVRLSHLDMWCVATISWPSGDVIPCVDVGDEPVITPNYQNPYFIPN